MSPPDQPQVGITVLEGQLDQLSISRSLELIVKLGQVWSEAEEEDDDDIFLQDTTPCSALLSKNSPTRLACIGLQPAPAS